MAGVSARLLGVELYFDDVDGAKDFYREVVCLERKGSESYPSSDKGVLFFEVPDLQAAMAIGENPFVQMESQWAVLHDPEGHNVLILQAGRPL